ncbi:MAG: PAS domain S-box protein [Methanomicrobiaceae archaeon]|nr:PAS domain S-box protein [Methanomicrobiaceae archaeon]
MIGNVHPLAEIRELLRKYPKGLSISEIARMLGQHRNTTAKYLDILQFRGDVDQKQIGTAKNYFPAHRIAVSSLLHFSPFPVVILNGRTEVVMVNGATLALFGCTLDVLYGEPAGNLPIPLFKDRALLDRYHDTLHGAKGSVRLHTVLAGGECDLLVHLIPVVFDTGREGCALVLLNETPARDLAERAARWQQRYEALLADTTEWVIHLRPDMTISYAGDAFCRRAGKTHEELTGFRFTPILSPADQTRVREALFAVTPEAPLQTLEVRTIRSDGEVCREQWSFRGIFTANSTPAEYHCIGRDTTAFRQMEAELSRYRADLESLVSERTQEMQEANQNLLQVIAEKDEVERELIFTRFAFNHASDSILLFDRQGVVYRANMTAGELLGYTPGELHETTVFTINPSISRAAWDRMWKEALPGRKERTRSVHRKKDGHIFDVEVSRTFVEFGEKMYFCSIAREITPE